MKSPASSICANCHLEISPARLKAMPDATQCAPCLTAAGDVVPHHLRPSGMMFGRPDRFEEILTSMTEAPSVHLAPPSFIYSGPGHEIEEVDT
jgi:hypothetical protein